MNTDPKPAPADKATSPSAGSVEWLLGEMKKLIIPMIAAGLVLFVGMPKLIEFAQAKALDAASQAQQASAQIASAMKGLDDANKNLDRYLKQMSELKGRVDEVTADSQQLTEQLAGIRTRCVGILQEVDSFFGDPGKEQRAVDLLKTISSAASTTQGTVELIGAAKKVPDLAAQMEHQLPVVWVVEFKSDTIKSLQELPRVAIDESVALDSPGKWLRVKGASKDTAWEVLELAVPQGAGEATKVACNIEMVRRAEGDTPATLVDLQPLKHNGKWCVRIRARTSEVSGLELRGTCLGIAMPQPPKQPS
jgi:hypothetical protein